MSLRPVWLMNPDLASRVLPLKAGLFDMVIYDEASQMPVEFALPTLYRGRVTVVSGDEKQMPPTAFFSSRVESDEAELFDGEAPDEDADEEQREATRTPGTAARSRTARTSCNWRATPCPAPPCRSTTARPTAS